jgi:hypothetical protein
VIGSWTEPPITFAVRDLLEEGKDRRVLAAQLDNGGHVTAIFTRSPIAIYQDDDVVLEREALVPFVLYDDMSEFVVECSLNSAMVHASAAAAIGVACAKQWDPSYARDHLAEVSKPGQADFAYLQQLIGLAPVICEAFVGAFVDQIAKLAASVPPAA